MHTKTVLQSSLVKLKASEYCVKLLFGRAGLSSALLQLLIFLWHHFQIGSFHWDRGNSLRRLDESVFGQEGELHCDEPPVICLTVTPAYVRAHTHARGN